jgi:transcriptional regulator with XRE-family HTH domain
MAKTATRPPAGELLRVWRKDHGLTQEQAASMVGITAPTWCDWESGQKIPRADLILLLEQASGGAVGLLDWAKAAAKWRKTGKVGLV